MITKFVKDSWLVLMAALVFGLGVSGIYGQLKPRIEQNAQLKIDRELKELFGEDAMIDPKIDPDDPEGKRVIYYQANRNGQTLGYALEAVGGGYAGDIGLLIAIDAELQILKGYTVLKSSESPGIGDKIMYAEFKDQFSDCPVGQKLIVTMSGDRAVADDKIVSITGATISSQAVVDIVNGGVEHLREIVKQ